MAQPKQLPTAGNGDPANPGSQVARSLTQIAPTTFVDPNADTVLRSRCGREFRVFSWMIKAHCTKLRDRVPSEEPIELDADRKAVKLFLNLMHNISMPAKFQWKLREQLFALCDETGCDAVIQIALNAFVEVVDLDPWAMFAVACERSHVGLARAAILHLKDAEEKLRRMTDIASAAGFGEASNVHRFPGDYNPANGFGKGFDGGVNHFPGGMIGGPSPQQPVSHQLLPAPNGTAPGKKGKKKLDTRPGAGTTNFASLNMILNKIPSDKSTVGIPFLIGMMNALMTSADQSGTNLSWDDIARNFKPAVANKVAGDKPKPQAAPAAGPA